MDEFQKWMGGCLFSIFLLVFLVSIVISIAIWTVKALQTLWILVLYFFIRFIPRFLVSILVLAIAVVVLLLIPALWAKLSIEIFSMLNRRNYSRTVSILTPSFSIITGLLLGLMTLESNLLYIEKMSVEQAPCGDNKSYISQNLYQVFVEKNDGETLKYLQKNYCQYAVEKYRKDENKKSILVASFQSESKAGEFVNLMELDREVGSAEVVQPGRTCQRSNNGGNLYPVFVNKTDAATLKYIKDNYCQDAAIQYRKDLKVAKNEDRQSILVTDFSDRAKAIEFARILQADSEVSSGDLGIPGFSCHQPNNPDLYPVFVNKTDAATLKYIRDNYCQDAKITDRKEDRQKYTNIPPKSILVALFKDKQQALDFARYLQKDSKIGSGELGTLGLY